MGEKLAQIKDGLVFFLKGTTSGRVILLGVLGVLALALGNVVYAIVSSVLEFGPEESSWVLLVFKGIGGLFFAVDAYVAWLVLKGVWRILKAVTGRIWQDVQKAAHASRGD